MAHPAHRLGGGADAIAVERGEFAGLMQAYKSELLAKSPPRDRKSESKKKKSSKKKSQKKLGQGSPFSLGSSPKKPSLLPLSASDESMALHTVDAMVPTCWIRSLLKQSLLKRQLANEVENATPEDAAIPIIPDALKANDESELFTAPLSKTSMQGILGLLDVIPSVVQSNPNAAVRVLAGLLKRSEAFEAGSLKNEPEEFFASIIERLQKLADQIPVIGGACCAVVLSLALARGDFATLLKTARAFVSESYSDLYMWIPESLSALVDATLREHFSQHDPVPTIGSTRFAPKDSTTLDLFRVLPFGDVDSPHPGEFEQCAIATDGMYLYLQNSNMIYKVLSGLGCGAQGRVVHVEQLDDPVRSDARLHLICVSGALLRFWCSGTDGRMEVLNPETLQVVATNNDIVCPETLFEEFCEIIPLNDSIFGSLRAAAPGLPWSFQRYEVDFAAAEIRPVGAVVKLGNVELGCKVMGATPWPKEHREKVLQTMLGYRVRSLTAAAKYVLMLTQQGTLLYLRQAKNDTKVKAVADDCQWEWQPLSTEILLGNTHVAQISGSLYAGNAFAIGEEGQLIAISDSSEEKPKVDLTVSGDPIVTTHHSCKVQKYVSSGFSFGSGWQCDVCNAMPSSDVRFRCIAGCDWDICKDCLKRNLRDMANSEDEPKLTLQHVVGQHGPIQCISTGKSISVAIDRDGRAWMTGASAGRALDFIPPSGAIVIYDDQMEPSGIEYPGAMLVSEWSKDYRCVVQKCQFVAHDCLQVHFEAQGSGKKGALPPAASSRLIVGLEAVNSTQCLSTEDSDNIRAGVLTFKSAIIRNSKGAVRFLYGGDERYTQTNLFRPTSIAVVPAWVDEEHCRKRDMSPDSKSLRVEMKGSGPKTIVSQESTNCGILRWKVSNPPGGNGAIEFGAISEKSLRDDHALHKKGKCGFSSSSTSGSALRGIDIANGEFFEVTVDATIGMFKVSFDSNKKRDFEIPLSNLDKYSPGDAVYLAITLWAGGQVQFEDLGQVRTVSKSHGLNDRALQLHPIKVKEPVTAVACGDSHSCLLLEGGDICTFGLNDDGQCGVLPDKNVDIPDDEEDAAADEDEESWISEPVLVPRDKLSKGVVNIACGGAHTLLVDCAGQVWSFGANSHGQLGRATPDNASDYEPGLVTVLPDDFEAIEVAAGSLHSLVTGKDGRVLGFGCDDCHQLGLQNDEKVVEISPAVAEADLTPTVVAWGHTNVIFSAKSAVNIHTQKIVGVYCDNESCVTVLAKNFDIDSITSLIEYPLFDNSYCASSSFEALGKSALYFDSVYDCLWSFDPQTSEVRRYCGIGEGSCSVIAAPAILPRSRKTPALVSAVGRSLLSLAGMAASGGAKASAQKKRVSPPQEAIRFPNGGTQSWNVSGSADAVCIKVSEPVALIGIRLFGDGSNTYNTDFEVAEDGGISSTFYGSTKSTLATGRVEGICNDEDGVGYSCLFDEPPELDEESKYHIIVNIRGNSTFGSSNSRAGNSGLKTIEGSDGVEFKISSSSYSNNGTGDASGQILGFLYRKCGSTSSVGSNAMSTAGESLGMNIEPTSNCVITLTSILEISMDPSKKMQSDVRMHMITTSLLLCSWGIRSWFFTDADGKSTACPCRALSTDAIDSIMRFKILVMQILRGMSIGGNCKQTSNVTNTASMAFSECFPIFFPDGDDQLNVFMQIGENQDRSRSVVLQLAIFNSILQNSQRLLNQVRANVQKGVEENDSEIGELSRGNFKSRNEYTNHVKSVVQRSIESKEPFLQVGIAESWTAEIPSNDTPLRSGRVVSGDDQFCDVVDDSGITIKTPYSSIVFTTVADSKKEATKEKTFATYTEDYAKAIRRKSVTTSETGAELFETFIGRLLSVDSIQSVLEENGVSDVSVIKSLVQSTTELLKVFTKFIFEHSFCVKEFINVCMTRTRDTIRSITDVADATRETISKSISESALLSKFVPEFAVHLTAVITIDSELAEYVLKATRELLDSIEELNAICKDILPIDEVIMPIETYEESIMVETDHPYARPKRDSRTIRFSSKVNFVILHFDSRCRTSQSEDSLSIYMTDDTTETKIISFSLDKWPRQSVIIPGNIVKFVFNSATNYAGSEIADEIVKCFGYKCTAQGRRVVNSSDCIHALENDLAMLAAKCATSMLKNDTSKKAGAEDMGPVLPLRWHPLVHGRSIKISSDGLTATRTSSYNYGLVVTDNPLRQVNGEKGFRFKMTRHEGSWSGSLGVGVSTYGPDGPESSAWSTSATVSEIGRKNNVWYMRGDQGYEGQTQVKSQLSISGRNLEGLRAGQIVKVSVTQDGSLYIGFGEGDTRVQVASNVPYTDDLYGFIDIYGKAVAMELLESNSESNVIVSVGSKREQNAYLESPLSLLRTRNSNVDSKKISLDSAAIHIRERQFLEDFVNIKANTAGGRLADWLVGTQYVDVCKCIINCREDSVEVANPCLFDVETRNSIGQLVYDENLEVKISARRREDNIGGNFHKDQTALLANGHVTSDKNGKYTLSWKSGKAAVFDVFITMDGMLAPGCPFLVTVVSSEAKKVVENALPKLSSDKSAVPLFSKSPASFGALSSKPAGEGASGAPEASKGAFTFPSFGAASSKPAGERASGAPEASKGAFTFPSFGAASSKPAGEGASGAPEASKGAFTFSSFGAASSKPAGEGVSGAPEASKGAFTFSSFGAASSKPAGEGVSGAPEASKGAFTFPSFGAASSKPPVDESPSTEKLVSSLPDAVSTRGSSEIVESGLHATSSHPGKCVDGPISDKVEHPWKLGTQVKMLDTDGPLKRGSIVTLKNTKPYPNSDQEIPWNYQFQADDGSTWWVFAEFEGTRFALLSTDMGQSSVSGVYPTPVSDKRTAKVVSDVASVGGTDGANTSKTLFSFNGAAASKSLAKSDHLPSTILNKGDTSAKSAGAAVDDAYTPKEIQDDREDFILAHLSPAEALGLRSTLATIMKVEHLVKDAIMYSTILKFGSRDNAVATGHNSTDGDDNKLDVVKRTMSSKVTFDDTVPDDEEARLTDVLRTRSGGEGVIGTGKTKDTYATKGKEIGHDFLMLRSKVLASDLYQSRGCPVCSEGHVMEFTKKALSASQEKKCIWACDAPGCKITGTTKKGATKSNKAKVTGTSRFACKACNKDICVSCTEKRVDGITFVLLLTATGKSDENDSKIQVFDSPHGGKRVGSLNVGSKAIVQVEGEAVDEDGMVWVQVSLSSSIALSLDDGYKGSAWVPYCTHDLSFYFRKKATVSLDVVAEKAQYLLDIVPPEDDDAEEDNDLSDPFSQSLHARLLAAHESTDMDQQSSVELARKLSVREGSVAETHARERSRQRSYGGSPGRPTQSLGGSKWTTVKSAVLNSSVALRDVVKEDNVGLYILQFIQSSISVSEAQQITETRLSQLSRRINGIKSLAALLTKSGSSETVHSVLWALSGVNSDTPLINNVASAVPNSTITLKHMSYNPLCDLNDDSHVTAKLRRTYHKLLTIILDFMKCVPHHHPVQHAALRCWAVNFDERDHSFLHQQHVFSRISNVLSNADISARVSPTKQVNGPIAYLEQDISDKVDIRVSSREAMVGSLTDGSTETFWESGDEEKNRKKFIYFDVPKNAITGTHLAFSLHIDNSRDSNCPIKKLTLKSGLNREDANVLSELSVSKKGDWYTMIAERGDLGAVVGVEISASASCRVRQVAVHQINKSEPIPLDNISADLCRGDALFVFQHLSNIIMGNVLGHSEDLDEQTELAGRINSRQRSGQEVLQSSDLQQHVASLIGNHRGKFSNMQKNLARHLVREIHIEAVAYAGPNTGIDMSPDVASSIENLPITDEYTFQLLSMILGLLGSNAGGKFIGQSPGIVFDLAKHLACGTPRVQRQVLAVLAKLIPSLNDEPTDSSQGDETASAAETLVPTLLYALAGSLSLQIRCKDQSKSASKISIRARDAVRSASAQVKDLFKGSITADIADDIMKLLQGLTTSSSIRTAIVQSVDYFKSQEMREATPETLIDSQDFWRALAGVCVLSPEVASEMNSREKPSQARPKCSNHDDGVTVAEWYCAACDKYYCSECDTVLHLSGPAHNHERKPLKIEEPDFTVDIHDDMGRIKLKNVVTNVNARTRKCLVEFKRARAAGASCRFCGDNLPDGPLANLGVCGLPSVCTICVDDAKQTCTKILPCGHPCQGVRGEDECLVCLYPGCASREGLEVHGDLEEECFCYSGTLSEQPCIKLHCNHVMHYACIRRVLENRWSGPRIDFNFAKCPVCRTNLIENENHPALLDLLEPIRALHESVRKKALMRLTYDGVEVAGTEADKAAVAMKKYAYYICYKCKKPYFGGEQACAAGASDDYDPSELVCGACIGGPAAQVCPKHGTDFLEYKCRFCCSVAVFFCFGTTHFCNPCHDEHSRCTNTAKEDMPQCPAGPVLKQLEGDECPLHVWHPPTGEEFCLGCGICRQAQTF